MAKLAVDTTLDRLITTIAEFELRVVELKQLANALATERGQRVPYLDVAPLVPPAARVAEVSEGPVADSQD